MIIVNKLMRRKVQFYSSQNLILHGSDKELKQDQRVTGVGVSFDLLLDAT